MTNESQTPKGVNIYELLRGFWRENEYEPFSTAAIAFYHFLIDRANTRRWKMPFSCPTEVAARAIGVTRQTVINARDTLQSRGLIKYTAGSGKKNYSKYLLTLDLSDSLTDHLTDDLTVDKTDALTDSLTEPLTESLTHDLTPLNIKNTNIKNTNINLFNKDEKRIFSLEELEDMLMKDVPWLNTIISTLTPTRAINLDELKEYLKRFFRHIAGQGFKGREVKECQQHFKNWMNKQPINTTQTTYARTTDTDRRGTEVKATSASEYEGAF